jgi:hypothetical protein
MGKECLMILLLGIASDHIAKTEPPMTTPQVATSGASVTPKAPNVATSAVKAFPPHVQHKCDVGPYKSLVGRTISDVLTLKLPPGTRIYRLGDPVTQPVGPGRLNIEINRGTRVGRIYCS